MVVRSCWDYVSRRDEFLAWATRVPNLANPAAVLAWNTHKGYLRELAVRDVPIVPTTWLPPKEEWTPPERGDWVIKPAVSLASLDAGRYRMDDRHQRRLAVEHVRRLHAGGGTVMVQPYMHGIDDEGETSLVYLGGVFSHAMRKAAVLTGPTSVLIGVSCLKAAYICAPTGRPCRSSSQPTRCWRQCPQAITNCCMRASISCLVRTVVRS